MFKKWLKECILMLLRLILIFTIVGAVFFLVAFLTYLMQYSIVLGSITLGVLIFVGLGIASYFEVKDR